MTDLALKRLLRKYEKNLCSKEELQIIDSLYESLETNVQIPNAVKENWEKFENLELKLLYQKLHTKKKRKVQWYYMGSAAAILLALGLFFLWQKYDSKTHSYRTLASILPGKSGAVLQSSSGEFINLEKWDSKIITIPALGSVNIQNGFFKYQPNNLAINKNGTNTIYTPLARQFKIELVDGTKVLLNSGSSIEFPTVFDKKIRKITIHGEAYLEVKHLDSIPFVVNVNNHLNIEDIGTSFNVSAYEGDEKEIITLVEGKIKIGNRMLSPMDQLIRSTNGSLENNKLDDVVDEIIWTKGFLNFNGKDYPALLRKISRWYNLEIKIDGKLPNQHISGNIPNNMPLSDLLKILENYGLNFNYKNNILTVSEKKNF